MSSVSAGKFPSDRTTTDPMLGATANTIVTPIHRGSEFAFHDSCALRWQSFPSGTRYTPVLYLRQPPCSPPYQQPMADACCATTLWSLPLLHVPVDTKGHGPSNLTSQPFVARPPGTMLTSLGSIPWSLPVMALVRSPRAGDECDTTSSGKAAGAHHAPTTASTDRTINVDAYVGTRRPRRDQRLSPESAYLAPILATAGISKVSLHA